MAFEKCEICGVNAFIRCEKHNKCDKCGLTKEESINKGVYLVHRTEGLICDDCFKMMVEIRVKNFEEDTDYRDDIICPYCGCEYGDCWEWGEDGEYKCDDCGNKFTYTRNTSVDYTTERILPIEVKEK